MLDHLITKEIYSDLNPLLQKEYALVGDQYHLQTNTSPKVQSLSSELLTLKSELKQARSELTSMKSNNEKLNSDLELAQNTQNSGEKRTEKLWQERLEKAEAQSKAAYKSLYDDLTRTILDDKAHALSAAISINESSVLAPHLRNRLDVELDNGQLIVSVKNADGSKSLMSTNDLLDEFRVNKDFAPFIKGSPATGGQSSNKPGAAGTPAGTPAPSSAGGQRADLLSMSKDEKLAYYQNKREALNS